MPVLLDPTSAYCHVSKRRVEVLLMGNGSLSRSSTGDIVRTG